MSAVETKAVALGQEWNFYLVTGEQRGPYTVEGVQDVGIGATYITLRNQSTGGFARITEGSMLRAPGEGRTHWERVES